ncbi:MAG: YidC/Oxa1 family membrane protein insertase [Candidatus Paceibacterota bacterium]
MKVFYFVLAHLFYFLLVFTHGIVWIPVLILSIGVRFLLWPFYQKASLNQRKIESLQPKIKEIQKKYLDKPLEANLQLKELFQKEKVNPYVSFIFVFVQIFLLIIFWNFFRLVIDNNWVSLLSGTLRISFEKFINQNPLNFYFFNVDLRRPNFLLTLSLAIFNFVFSIFQAWFQGQRSSSTKKAKVNSQYFSSLLSFLILLFYQGIPSILIVYWFGFSLVGIIQEIVNYRFYLNHKKSKEIKNQITDLENSTLS